MCISNVTHFDENLWQNTTASFESAFKNNRVVVTLQTKLQKTLVEPGKVVKNSPSVGSQGRKMSRNLEIFSKCRYAIKLSRFPAKRLRHYDELGRQVAMNLV